MEKIKKRAMTESHFCNVENCIEDATQTWRLRKGKLSVCTLHYNELVR